MNVILHMNCSDTTKVDVSLKENYIQRKHTYQIPKVTYERLRRTTYTETFTKKNLQEKKLIFFLPIPLVKHDNALKLILVISCTLKEIYSIL
jgi:hypothetical protein